MSLMTAATPMRTRTIVVDRLPASARAAEIEALARAKDVTPYQRRITLRAVAHGSLWGDALWAAWMRAEAAVVLCDQADEDDPRYRGLAREKKAAIRALIYGDAADYDGGGAA